FRMQSAIRSMGSIFSFLNLAATYCVAKNVRPSTREYFTAGVTRGLTTLIPSVELNAIATGTSGNNFTNLFIFLSPITTSFACTCMFAPTAQVSKRILGKIRHLSSGNRGIVTSVLNRLRRNEETYDEGVG